MMANNYSNKKPFRYRPDQFRHTAQFGKIVSKENPYSGAMISEFEPEFSLHYALVRTTLSMRYEALGTTWEGTKTIAVRHGKAKDATVVEIDGTQYKILDSSLDDDNYISYDLLTLQATKKGK